MCWLYIRSTLFFGSDFPSCCLMTWQSSPDELLFETWVKNLFFFFRPLRQGENYFFKIVPKSFGMFLWPIPRVSKGWQVQNDLVHFWSNVDRCENSVRGNFGEKTVIFVKLFFNFCCSCHLERYKNLLRKNFFFRKKIFSIFSLL